MAKTNIQILKDIITELTETNTAKRDEAIEFLDSLQSELDEKEDELRVAEEAVADANSELTELQEELDLSNVEELGLDTLRWELDNGNLRIQQEIENFVLALKKRYIGVAA